MTEERKENPAKRLAIQLTHVMLDEERMREEILSPREEEELRAYGNWLRLEIAKSGYNIHTILNYVEEYKTLKWDEFNEWRYL